METPPGGFVDYPRGQSYGSGEALRDVAKAYFGGYWIVGYTLLIGVLGAVAGFMIGFMTRDPNTPLLGSLVFGIYAVLFIGNFLVAFRFTKLLARAKNKERSYAVLLAIGACLLSPCIFGLAGAAVVQQAAANELKKYGLRAGFMGVRKQDVEALAAQLDAQAAYPTPPL